MNRKPIEQFEIGQYVESTDLRKVGKILKIMPLKKVVQIEFTHQGNNRTLVTIQFGRIFNVKKC